MPLKIAFTVALILSASVVGAADLVADTTYDCSRSVAIRCAALRSDNGVKLLIWQPETPEEEQRKERNHEKQLIEHNFKAGGGREILIREINLHTGQLVERACLSEVCSAWNPVALPEMHPIGTWEQLSN